MSLVPNSFDPFTKSDLTVEVGNGASGPQPWDAFYDNTEDIAQLAWPMNIAVYNKMRNDSQIAALMLAFMLPIFGYRWAIDPNGASDQATEHVANDLNLPIKGQDPKPQGRQRGRFSMGDYLYHCMLKMAFGFMLFEQVYRLGDDSKFHIRKLAPRMPGSIWQIQTAGDGGLEYIRQYPTGVQWDPNRPNSFFNGADVGRIGGMYSQGPIITVDRLVAHVQDKEGGNWYGRSWLRAIYKEWLVKDRLIRVDAMKHERNGMGVPTIEAPPGASKAQMIELARLAEAYKAGEASGGSLPNGAKLTLNGVSGSLPDTVASIKMHNQAMANRFLAMFTSLGQTESGSRSLGETFVDFFGLAQQSLAKSVADVTNEHVIEDLIDINYSISENAPLLVFEPESDRALPTSDLVALVQVGALTPDDDLEEWIRANGDLPARNKSEQSNIPPPTDGTPPANRDRKRPHLTIVNAAKKNDQRQPTEIEQQSKVDFAAIKQAFSDALTQLTADWTTNVKQPQINELVALIAATPADDLAALATIKATARGGDILGSAMHDLATKAADTAAQEITDQGVETEAPDLQDLKDALTTRANAVEVLMANSISQAASEHALPLAGGGQTSTDIAMAVGDHLNSLTDTYLTDELGGALMAAQNGGRGAVFDSIDAKDIYSSELLDSSTCLPCSEIDGHHYPSVSSAQEDYVTGGFKNCLGGVRCRGLYVCVLKSEAAPSVQ